MSAPVFGRDAVCERCGAVHAAGECPDWQRVDSAEWEAQAAEYLRSLEPGATFTAEDVTRRLLRPWNPNSIGAAFRAAAAAGVIVRAGPLKRAARSARHANRIYLWRRTGQ